MFAKSVAIRCQVRNPWAKSLAQRKDPVSQKHLVGTPKEITLTINNIICTALFETGATVPSISEEFYVHNLSHLEMQRM